MLHWLSVILISYISSIIVIIIIIIIIIVIIVIIIITRLEWSMYVFQKLSFSET